MAAPSAEDYLARLKDRLFLDWEDPVFRGPLFVSESGEPRQRLKSLVSPRSEDALTWSVFHAFQRLPPPEWLAALFSQCRTPPPASQDPPTLRFWESGPQARAPLTLVIETAEFAAVIEGKYAGDVGSTAGGDQIGRCIDAALALAVPHRRPYFVLITDDYAHPQADPMARWLGPSALPGEAPPEPDPYVPVYEYERLMPRYRDDSRFRASRLPQRTPDELAGLEGRIGWLSWADLVDGVLDRSAQFSPQQKKLLQELVNFLRPKRLLHKGS